MKALWKIITRHPFLLVSMALLVLLVLQRECAHQQSCPGSDTLTTVSATTDTLIITRNHYLPAPPPDTVIHYDTIFPDTAAILADYSALRIYNRTLLDDSTGKISLLDSVQFNSLQSSQFSAVLFQKHTVETVTHTVYQPQPQKVKIFIGLTLGASYPQIDVKPVFTPQITFFSKCDRLYSFACNPFCKFGSVSISWKILYPHILDEKYKLK